MAFTGRIEEIFAQYDSQHLTIYKPGQAVTRVQVPQGKSWELHIKTTGNWPEEAPWSTALTLGGGTVTGANAKMNEFADGNYEFAFNMGSMPSGSVNVGRARFWRNAAWTNVPPPADMR